MAQLPRSRFPPISLNTRAQIGSAQLRGIAEPLARAGGTPNVTGADAPPTPAGLQLDFFQFSQLMRGLYQVASIQQFPFTAGVAAIQLRPQEPRTYVFVQNQAGAGQIILGIGKPPAVGPPADGIIIGANLGFYEPIKVPIDELWVLGSGAGIAGCLLVGFPPA